VPGLSDKHRRGAVRIRSISAGEIITESVEIKLARIEEKQDQILRRLENGDANFKEFEKRIARLEQQVYAVMLVGGGAWLVFLSWFRMSGG
jgi:hypothetical protein